MNLNLLGEIMKMALTLCVLILGQPVFAGTSGGLDDGPIAAPKPAVKQPAAANKAPNAKDDDDDDDMPPIKQCKAGLTDSPAEIRNMFNHVLGIKGGFPFTLKSKAKTKLGDATVTVEQGKNTVTLTILVTDPYLIIPATAGFCQRIDKSIQVTSETTYGPATFILTKIGANSTRVLETKGKFDGAFEAKAAK